MKNFFPRPKTANVSYFQRKSNYPDFIISRYLAVPLNPDKWCPALQRCIEYGMGYVQTRICQMPLFNPLNPKLNPICYLLALLGAYHFLHISRIRLKLLTFRLLMSYIYGAPILDVSRSHTTTQHSR